MFFTGIYMSKPSRTEVAFDSNRITDNTNSTNKKSLNLQNNFILCFNIGEM